MTLYIKAPVLGNLKIKVFKSNGELEEQKLTINDLDLHVHNQAGSIVERDV